MARRTYTLKQLLKALEEQGWTIEQGKGHIKAWPANRHYPVEVISATASDGRAMKNAIAGCRRKGASL